MDPAALIHDMVLIDKLLHLGHPAPRHAAKLADMCCQLAGAVAGRVDRDALLSQLPGHLRRMVDGLGEEPPPAVRIKIDLALPIIGENMEAAAQIVAVAAQSFNWFFSMYGYVLQNLDGYLEYVRRGGSP